MNDASSERRWQPGHPLDLHRTLAPLQRGPGDPACRTTGDGAVWRASRTPAGIGTLRVASAYGEVLAQAWGPGAEWLLDRLPLLLGSADDPSGLLLPPGPLRDAQRANPGLRLCRTGLVLESLVPAVLEQKVTSDEAYRAWRLLLREFGTPAPGPAPELRVPPSAREWCLIPSWAWHRAGVDPKRSATVVRAARLAPRLEQASGLSGAEAAARLTAVPGVGEWTAAETLQRCNGDPDAVSVGDYHLPDIVGWALAGRPRSDDAQLLELLAPYQGHRHRVCRLIALSGLRPPRYGPRLAPSDHRGR
ncbi:3-methyladenine DNA glycosylase/8-oxoguanine DNA glycosylase [Kitasatospora sp. MAP12-15]|uniref:DNA-3-methyladenine glycosylase family protein n=1 Tax=unclassified Kitasatospora TaxID=2633591 RepID=UPI002473E759|nr:DNA-3-methyladenine glycosylase 2 family protein [Kitasatospora sp. MAP12-44]MDH6110806.1 3-methyladenine DNA glycosylase/8-oxoguanine DNA glycosylase [Kitasatospora sp. MAP12-44]